MTDPSLAARLAHYARGIGLAEPTFLRGRVVDGDARPQPGYFAKPCLSFARA